MAKFSFKEKIKEEVKFDDGIRGKKIVLYNHIDLIIFVFLSVYKLLKP